MWRHGYRYLGSLESVALVLTTTGAPTAPSACSRAPDKTLGALRSTGLLITISPPVSRKRAAWAVCLATSYGVQKQGIYDASLQKGQRCT